MDMSITKEKMLRWGFEAAVVLLVLVVAFAAVLYFKVDELEASLAQARADADRTSQTSAAATRKMQEQLKAATAKAAELEMKQREPENMKALMAKVEPQVVPILEAAAAAKNAKPETRVATLTAIGLIGQIAHGASNDASLGVLLRALAIDKTNCVAGLALTIGGAKSIEVAPECQALLPPPAAAEVKPASDAAPAAAPAGTPAAAPAGGAAKDAAGKS